MSKRHDQYKKVQEASFLGLFFTPETDMIFGDGVGASLSQALIANSMLVCVTLMCFDIGTAQLKKVHGGLKTEPSRRHRILGYPLMFREKTNQPFWEFPMSGNLRKTSRFTSSRCYIVGSSP